MVWEHAWSRGPQFNLSKASSTSNKMVSPSRQSWSQEAVPQFFPQRLRGPPVPFGSQHFWTTHNLLFLGSTPMYHHTSNMTYKVKILHEVITTCNLVLSHTRRYWLYGFQTNIYCILGKLLLKSGRKYKGSHFNDHHVRTCRVWNHNIIIRVGNTH